MNVPVLVLLSFAAWTLLTLFGSVGVYRWSRILTRRASIAEWRADAPQGSEWYQRAMRAHMNCVENLPIFGALVIALMATGLQRPSIDALSLTLLGRPDSTDSCSYCSATLQRLRGATICFILCSDRLHDRDRFDHRFDDYKMTEPMTGQLSPSTTSMSTSMSRWNTPTLISMMTPSARPPTR
jgi:MAPEG family